MDEGNRLENDRAKAPWVRILHPPPIWLYSIVVSTPVCHTGSTSSILVITAIYRGLV